MSELEQLDLEQQDAQLRRKVQEGYIVESVEEMTPGYLKALKQILMVQADTELMSAPAYFSVTQDAPTLNARIAASAIIQDELGHAHIAYRLLEDLGEDKERLIYGRQPHEFKNPYGFDQPLENWAELVTAHGFFDRAGITLLTDIHEHTSYGPWKRALIKIGKEETFHLRHGESWMRRLAAKGGELKRQLQRAVDWMFPTGVEWFGLPDSYKKHSAQLAYRLKGMTNDELRQKWLSAVVPLCQEIGLEVPAHYDSEEERWVVEYAFPVAYDPERKAWQFDQPISWEQMFERWKGRGPMNGTYVKMIQGNGARGLFASR